MSKCVQFKPVIKGNFSSCEVSKVLIYLDDQTVAVGQGPVKHTTYARISSAVLLGHFTYITMLVTMIAGTNIYWIINVSLEPQTNHKCNEDRWQINSLLFIYLFIFNSLLLMLQLRVKKYSNSYRWTLRLWLLLFIQGICSNVGNPVLAESVCNLGLDLAFYLVSYILHFRNLRIIFRIVIS